MGLAQEKGIATDKLWSVTVMRDRGCSGVIIIEAFYHCETAAEIGVHYRRETLTTAGQSTIDSTNQAMHHHRDSRLKVVRPGLWCHRRQQSYAESLKIFQQWMWKSCDHQSFTHFENPLRAKNDIKIMSQPLRGRWIKVKDIPRHWLIGSKISNCYFDLRDSCICTGCDTKQRWNRERCSPLADEIRISDY